MKPNLPRQFLWTEVRTLEEFLSDDITNHGLYHIVKELPQELFPEGSDIVELFNEMYYMMTRFYYEEPKTGEYREYQKTIINDLKWNGCSDLVLIMMYTYFRFKELQPKPAVEAFLKYMKVNFWWSEYWPFFINYTSTVLRYPPSKFDPKVPHPVPAKELIGVKLDFEKITCSHNFEAIQEIVNLWTDEDSRKIIAKILLDDVSKYSSSFITNLDDIKNWLDTIIDDDNKKQVIELQKRIESLKAENEMLRCELNEGNVPEEAFNKKTGKSCFTSSQMGILIQAIANLTETTPPGKSTLGDIVEKIAGYSSTTLNQNMKGGHRPKDVKTVAEVFEKKLPNLAAAVRKL